MDAGFETIGNATLICHDRKPVLVTDPWLTGGAYFQSWIFSHEIPEPQMNAILASPYVWLSHGHPDHLSAASLKLLAGKKILLPDHAGRRIYDGLKLQGHEVHILKDRAWTKLSERIRVLSIADYNQDAVLLIDLNGRLLINTNDASDRGWGNFVKETAKGYKVSFLLCISGFDDADMINYFDENGRRILPAAAKKRPFGGAVARRAERLGAKYFIPFSSMHRYQRKDSLWANDYTTKLSDYAVGFDSQRCEILPAYVRYDCTNDRFEEIRPRERELQIVDPEKIGDSWKEPLEKKDFELAEKYFKSIEALEEGLGFINLRVAGKDHEIKLGTRHRERGITFEVPRNSLMAAVQYEIFDDLLIGNFMKTTLHGPWKTGKLYPYFTPYVAKYADNGKARTREELHQYFKEYRERALFDFVRHQIESKAKTLFWSVVRTDTSFYHLAKKTYHGFRKISSRNPVGV